MYEVLVIDFEEREIAKRKMFQTEREALDFADKTLIDYVKEIDGKVEVLGEYDFGAISGYTLEYGDGYSRDEQLITINVFEIKVE